MWRIIDNIGYNILFAMSYVAIIPIVIVMFAGRDTLYNLVKLLTNLL